MADESIFVLGSFVVSCSAKVSRFPRPGESLAADIVTIEPGGKGLNLAVAARRLGAGVDGLLAVGDDIASAFAAPALAKFFTPGTTAAAAFKAHKAATGKAARLATQPAGSVPNTTLQYWLWEVAKADKGDIEVVTMGIDATQQAVLAGAVEGGIVREPALTIVQTRNPGIKLIAGGQELFPGQPGTVVAGSGAFVTRNPEAVQKLVNSLVRAADLIAKNPDKAAPHVGAALGKGIVDPELIRKALVSPASTFEIDPRKIIEPSRAMQAYQVKLGSLEKELPFDGLFETQFYERAAKAAG